MALLERREGLLRKWGTTVVLATMSAQFLPMADQVIALAEGGTVADIGSFGELVRRDGGYVKAAFSTTQTQDRVKDESPAAEDAVASSSATKTASSSSPSPAKVAVRASVTKDDKKEQSERAATDKKRQVGDMTIYSYYFGTVGPAIVAGLLVLELTAVFLTTFPTVWLKWWSDANNASPNARDGYYLGGYWGFQVSAAVASALLTWFVFAVIAVRSGVELHSRLLRSVMRAPLRFFAGTDTGSLVTRFSQDIGLVDLNLPLALLMTISCFFTVIGKAGLIASATGYVAISFPFILAVFYFLQRGYLRTSRQLRFLDLEEKAPV